MMNLRKFRKEIKKNLHIVHELSRNQHTGDKHTVDTEGINRQIRLVLNKPIEINISHNETRRTAIGVCENPFEVVLDWDIGLGECMEDWGFLSLMKSAVDIVRLCNSMKERGETLNDLRQKVVMREGGGGFSHFWLVVDRRWLTRHVRLRL